MIYLVEYHIYTHYHLHTLSFCLNILRAFTNSSSEIVLQQKKEGNVLYNDVLNTFYLRLYGVQHIVKDH